MMSRFLKLVVISAFSFVAPMAYAQDTAAPAAVEAQPVTEENVQTQEPVTETAVETTEEPVAEAAATSDETPAAPSAATSEVAQDFERRIALATEMHKLRPTAEQVDAAVASVARQLPPEQAGNFKINAGNMLNYRAIENISINAMAETFTTQELEAMVEYYSKQEAKSIATKYETYQQKVGPEIVQMIDRAIMKMRTGDAAP